MLDARTLIIAVSISLISTLITVLISGIINRNINGVRQWMSGYILLAAGLLLQGTQGLIQPLFSVFLANVVITNGFAMLWLGLLKYKDRAITHSWVVLTSLSMMIIVLHAVAGLGPEGFGQRTIYMSLISGVLTLFCALALLKPFKGSSPAERFTGLIFILMGLALAIRAIAVITLPENLLTTQSNTHNYFTYIMAMVFNILLSFGLIIMPSERLQNRLSRQADTDFLTGILSRRAFTHYAERLIGRNRKQENQLSLLLFDLDNFKDINDQYGHSAGDEVLRKICQAIMLIIRPTDLFGRIGGEEFAILLNDTARENAHTITERIRQSVENCVTEYEGHSITTTISLGLTTLGPETKDFENLYKETDSYLYQAKKTGKNRIVSADTTASKTIRSD